MTSGLGAQDGLRPHRGDSNLLVPCVPFDSVAGQNGGVGRSGAPPLEIAGQNRSLVAGVRPALSSRAAWWDTLVGTRWPVYVMTTQQRHQAGSNPATRAREENNNVQ